MRYKEFLAEYKRVHQAWAYGHMPTENVATEISRLRTGIPQLEPERREYAELPLARWQSNTTGAQADRRGRAFEIYVRASRAAGTEDDRLEQYRRAMAAIAAIADETDDQLERAAIEGYNESLARSIHSIGYDRENSTDQ